MEEEDEARAQNPYRACAEYWEMAMESAWKDDDDARFVLAIALVESRLRRIGSRTVLSFQTFDRGS